MTGSGVQPLVVPDGFWARDPVLDALRRRDDENVLVALVDQALDDAAAGEGFPGARAVGVEHAVAVGLFKAPLSEGNVVTLFGEECRERAIELRRR